MNTLSDLIKELETLPIGNVYKKQIRGKTYHYYQYFKNGQRFSEIISREKMQYLIPKINRRKQVEDLIRKYRNKERNFVLSKNASRLTGHVMCGDIPVATFKDGLMYSYHESLAPLIIQRTHSLERFLKLRVIDISRTNARLLLKSLNIHVDDEFKIALYSYALSINDNYWFRPKNSKLGYKDVSFKNDNYFDTALKGDTTIFARKNKVTPEITTTGSFEKGWRLIKGHWWLYKNGNKKQLFSELFCYEFAKLIELKTAKYEYDGDYIRSKNFAEKYNFEPIASLADDNDDYTHVFPIIYQISKNIAKEYLKMMMFDAVVNNVDRHNENYGLLRDKQTGEIISLAPNFDNNLALISTVEMINSNPKKDGLIQTFVRFLKENKTAKSLYKEIRFKEINTDMIKNCILSIPIKLDDSDQIIDAVYLRYLYLKDLFS